MTRKAAERRQPSNPDLPTALESAVCLAKQGSFPNPSDDELSQFPNLLQILSPMLVRDPRYNGKGEAPLVLREPLLMLSWDRLNAAWRVALTDKVLNLTGAIAVESLLTALSDVERMLSAGEFPWKEKKVS